MNEWLALCRQTAVSNQEGWKTSASAITLSSTHSLRGSESLTITLSVIALNHFRYTPFTHLPSLERKATKMGDAKTKNSFSIVHLFWLHTYQSEFISRGVQIPLKHNWRPWSRMVVNLFYRPLNAASGMHTGILKIVKIQRDNIKQRPTNKRVVPFIVFVTRSVSNHINLLNRSALDSHQKRYLDSSISTTIFSPKCSVKRS